MNTCIRGMYILSRSSMYQNIPKHIANTDIKSCYIKFVSSGIFHIFFKKSEVLFIKMLFKAGYENFSLRNLGAEITVKNHIG